MRKGNDKNVNPIIYLPDVSSDMLKLFFEAFHLKQIYREGWLRKGIKKKKTETDAEHIFGVVFMTMIISKRFPEIDMLKVIQMAIIHELGEIDAGDIPTPDNFPKKEKYKIEHACIERLFRNIKDGEKYIKIWEEFEESKTIESKVVKMMDKLEMLVTALIYECHGYSELSEFYSERIKALLSHPDIKDILDEILHLRKSIRG